MGFDGVLWRLRQPQIDEKGVEGEQSPSGWALMAFWGLEEAEKNHLRMAETEINAMAA